MAAYWVAHVAVSDAETYGEYAKRAGPAIASHGGRFLARGGRCVGLEGNTRPRNVVVEFPNIEAAESCYRSPEYQDALGFARGASERDLMIIDGVAP